MKSTTTWAWPNWASGTRQAPSATCGVRASVKWPNDLWIDGRKVAGVLVEARGYRPEAPALVAGFGIDVNQSAADFPEELRDVATSLAIATGRRHDRAARTGALLRGQGRRPRLSGEPAGHAV